MSVSNAMKDHLKGTTTLAVFVKMTAADGDIIAVTNASKNKIINGLEYKSIPLSPTQLQSTQGLKADNLELVTILGGLYTSATLRARKWVGAKVEYAVYNYKDFAMGYATRKIGYIGDTELGKFTAKPEILSLSNKLTQPVGFSMLETCNVVRLGDSRCKLDLNGNTVDGYRLRINATITQVVNKQQFAVSFNSPIKPANSAILTAPDDLFHGGTVEFTSGQNDGLETLILANEANGITIFLPTFYNIAVGDTVQLTVGCNRTIKQCVEKFNNGENNRSFWMLPGRTKLFKLPE
jgi:uncharacterized phage protein (TIGR02218 family)